MPHMLKTCKINNLLYFQSSISEGFYAKCLAGEELEDQSEERGGFR